ncbi:hypothetical protein ACLKA7_000246 [Drosophila subpalustris]
MFRLPNTHICKVLEPIASVESSKSNKFNSPAHRLTLQWKQLSSDHASFSVTTRKSAPPIPNINPFLSASVKSSIQHIYKRNGNDDSGSLTVGHRPQSSSVVSGLTFKLRIRREYPYI